MTTLLFTDLSIALSLVMLWMWQDARERGVSVIPYVLLTFGLALIIEGTFRNFFGSSQFIREENHSDTPMRLGGRHCLPGRSPRPRTRCPLSGRKRP